MQEETDYICQSCGEVIVVPVDISAGTVQTYLEDCPVCCYPHIIHVEIGSDGSIYARAELE